MTVLINENSTAAKIQISGHDIELRLHEYSPWLRLAFPAGLGLKIHGIRRFYLICLAPEFELYVSPVHIDPEKPALPISHPFIYSRTWRSFTVRTERWVLPKTLGRSTKEYSTNPRSSNRPIFFLKSGERMLASALERTPRGLITCVFDTSDRIQHMFFRCLDESHPANRGKEFRKYQSVIEEMYVRMDQLLAKVLERADERTVVIVMSDHGFTNFKRGVNLNTWLFQHGYLKLQAGHVTSGDWFKGVDWENTQAFALPDGHLHQPQGTRVSWDREGGQRVGKACERNWIAKLTGLADDETGETAILEVIDTQCSFRGPYLDDAPDLLVGYNHGYRNSWACATGRVTETIFEDNTRHWSGDHCVAPRFGSGSARKSRDQRHGSEDH